MEKKVADLNLTNYNRILINGMKKGRILSKQESFKHMQENTTSIEF